MARAGGANLNFGVCAIRQRERMIRENEQGRVGGESVDLLPIQVNEIALVWNPGLYGAAASAISELGSNVAILPGFRRPLGS
jgi:hypothetical protein